MQVSFYVLSPHKAPDTQAVLIFVCQLIQTVLQKSEHRLVVVDDDATRLGVLDNYLWDFSPTSFIPHQLDIISTIMTDTVTDTSENTPPSINTDINTNKTILQDGICPVLLSNTFPTHFNGIILNLSNQAVPLSHALIPERILEIISTDADSQQHGRNKYQHYRNLGLSLNHYKL